MKQGWEVCNLEDYIKLIDYRGRTPVKTEHGVRLITAKNVKIGYLELNPQEFINPDSYDAWMSRGIPNIGDVIFTTEAPLGNVAQLDTTEKVAFAQRIIVMQPQPNKIDQTFLKYLLISGDVRNEILEKGTGATVKGIKSSLLKKIQLNLPNIQEQRQIVFILDKAFDAIAQAKANAERNLKNARELFESYLSGIFENKGEGWKEEKLKSITSKIGSGATPRGGNESYKTEGISLIRSMNVHDFKFKEKNLAFIDDQQARELNNVTLQEDDVLLNITGASVARCCLIPKVYLPARVNQHVSIIRAKKEIIESAFLNLLLASKYYKDQLLFTGEQGATRQAITKAQLEEFVITFPKALPEQKAILQKVNALSAQTKELEAIYLQKIADLDELKNSLLQKAFNGELLTTQLAI
jgi:type I restriction enzyme S subunit